MVEVRYIVTPVMHCDVVLLLASVCIYWTEFFIIFSCPGVLKQSYHIELFHGAEGESCSMEFG